MAALKNRQNRVERFDVVIGETKGGDSEKFKEVLVVASIEEVRNNLPGVVSQLTDKQRQRVLLVVSSGSCSECAGSNRPCVHLGQSVPSVNQVFNLDIAKIGT